MTGFNWRFVTPLYIGSALNPINSSLIATALVPIAHGLHVSVGQTAILVSVLYLASAIAQPTAGKLGEVFGPRRVFFAGIITVFAGGVVGGLGHSLASLTVARVLIGIGTSGAYPTAMLIVRRRAAEVGLDQPPGRVLGGLQIAGVATAALGLPLGGFITDGLGWHATFLINVPVAIIALALSGRWLPADPPLARIGWHQVASQIDLTGIVLFAGALSGLLLFIQGLPRTRWTYLAITTVIAVGLVGWELRARTPFLDVRLLVRRLPLTRTYLRFGLTALCVYSVPYGVSDWLEVAHGYSARTVGLLILPMSAASALLIRPVSDRNLVRSALIVSGGACLGGATGFLLIGSTSPVAVVVVLTLVFGVALGTWAPANQTALYQQADPAQIGTAAGLLRTFGYLGSIASAAITAAVFHTAVTDHGLHTIAAVMIVVSMVSLALALLDRHLRSDHRQSGKVAEPDPDTGPTIGHRAAGTSRW